MNEGFILLVEDNPDDVELTLRAFQKVNITNEVVVANDGLQALEYLSDHTKELPQVILLDLKLPKISGIEVLQKIRAGKRTQMLPVVILTSSKEDKDIVDSYRLGANSYVPKPVDFVEFMEAAKRLGLFWLLVNQGPPVRPR